MINKELNEAQKYLLDNNIPHVVFNYVLNPKDSHYVMMILLKLRAVIKTINIPEIRVSFNNGLTFHPLAWNATGEDIEDIINGVENE